jgi:uncharacterized heparinase superfamily protein
MAPSRFRFLNVEHDINRSGWDDAAVEKLWRYNLHYFDDLNSRDAAARANDHRALLTRWIDANPPARGTAWEPYPVSQRIVNWIKWFLGGTSPDPRWLHSLAVQARWLDRRLEVHLLGNHLFTNAKALIFAGVFFEGTEADRWLARGVEIMRRELSEQVLPDGGQFERSPMYHALAFEDVLDLLNVTPVYPAAHPLHDLAPTLRASGEPMLYWLRCMSHPDGGLGSFNDSADGIAPSLPELERYARDLGIQAAQPIGVGVVYLEQSGYVRVARGPAVALLDVAPIGPDYLPAHAHADTLSFELSLRRQRLIVNGGTSCYGASQQRMRERSTRSHSTVEIAGKNSSEVWSGFRVGRRARPSHVTVDDSTICCSHDGYRFLRGRPVHRRCWRFGDRELLVEDRVSPSASPAVARYILASGLRLRPQSSSRWQVLLGATVLAGVEVAEGVASAVAASYAPRFGVLVPVDCLAIDLVEGRASTCWTWTDEAHAKQ